MKTVEDLGRNVKAKYPGIYDHLSDEEVGRAVKAKYPNEYSHYEDATLDIPQIKISNDTAHLDRLLVEMDKLANLYNADRGRITSWWQRGKAESRGKMLFALNEEMRLIIEVISLRSQAHSAEWRHKAALEVEQLLHRNQKAILEIATSQGMDVGVYQQKLLIQLEVDKEILLMREQSNIKVDEYREIKEIDKNVYQFEKGIDVQGAIIASLEPIYQVNFLTQELNKILDRRELLLLEPDSDRKKKMLKRLDKNIKLLNEAIDAKGQGLIQGNERPKLGAMDED